MALCNKKYVHQNFIYEIHMVHCKSLNSEFTNSSTIHFYFNNDNNAAEKGSFHTLKQIALFDHKKVNTDNHFGNHNIQTFY